MFDYHVHSIFSDDAVTPIDVMIQTAISRGIKEIAITDHYDPDYTDPNYPCTIDLDEYGKALEQAQEFYKDEIKIVKGIEMGLQHGGTLTKCEIAAAAFPYDFIIGAFHHACSRDLETQFFKERSAEEGIYDYYTYVTDSLSVYKDYDIFGHINVVDRYTPFIPDYAPFMEIIEKLLKVIIADGKGLEFNTSSIRRGLGDRTTPPQEIIALYKSLGGEIITIGSDAHKAEHVGYGYSEAVDILKANNFKYITLFDNRTPRFERI